jgi:Domain of unknown function (DUF4384)
MPIGHTFATTVLAGVLACGGLSVLPCYAAENSASEQNAPLHRVFQFDDDDDDDRAQTRDLRPTPDRPRARPRVTLRPSSPVVRIGRAVSFEISTNVDGYAHMYVVSASGRAQVWLENVPISPGRNIRFPTNGNITAAPPVGQDDIVLIVTRDRVKGFLGWGSTRTPRVLSYSPGAFREAVRERFEDLPRRDWSYDRTVVRVVSGGGAPGGGVSDDDDESQ